MWLVFFFQIQKQIYVIYVYTICQIVCLRKFRYLAKSPRKKITEENTFPNEEKLVFDLLTSKNLLTRLIILLFRVPKGGYLAYIIIPAMLIL